MEENQFDKLAQRDERVAIAQALLEFCQLASTFTETGINGVFVMVAVAYIDLDSGGANLTQISNLTGLSRSSVRRTLEILIDEHHIVKNTDGAWPIYSRWIRPQDLDRWDEFNVVVIDLFKTLGKSL